MFSMAHGSSVVFPSAVPFLLWNFLINSTSATVAIRNITTTTISIANFILSNIPTLEPFVDGVGVVLRLMGSLGVVGVVGVCGSRCGHIVVVTLVVVSPGTVVGSHVVVSPGTVVGSHVVVSPGTVVGSHVVVSPSVA